MSFFPQLRKDPIIDRWVLIAPERGVRPMELADRGEFKRNRPCPFCEGHETRTPHEVFAVRRPGTLPDTPGWQIRVVSNMFPAARRDAPPSQGRDLLEACPGYGVHEVVVESPRHDLSLTDLPCEHVRSILQVYQQRVAALARDSRLQYVQVFKNQGAAAGASVEHVHSQILGVPIVPRDIAAELAGAAAYFRSRNRCVFCELIERELADGERIVLANERAVAVTAFAGRFPYEMWILPRHHGSDFQSAGVADLDEMADVLRTLLDRLQRRVLGINYNLVLKTAPLQSEPRPDYHWHWRILPRTTGIAGFELSTGWFINPVPPELAAQRLRE
jgi:UDPglucose--hexose-1-phosphate uridylyltransferase